MKKLVATLIFFSGCNVEVGNPMGSRPRPSVANLLITSAGNKSLSVFFGASFGPLISGSNPDAVRSDYKASCNVDDALNANRDPNSAEPLIKVGHEEQWRKVRDIYKFFFANDYVGKGIYCIPNSEKWKVWVDIHEMGNTTINHTFEIEESNTDHVFLYNKEKGTDIWTCEKTEILPDNPHANTDQIERYALARRENSEKPYYKMKCNISNYKSDRSAQIKDENGGVLAFTSNTSWVAPVVVHQYVHGLAWENTKLKVAESGENREEFSDGSYLTAKYNNLTFDATKCMPISGSLSGKIGNKDSSDTVDYSIQFTDGQKPFIEYGPEKTKLEFSIPDKC